MKPQDYTLEEICERNEQLMEQRKLPNELFYHLTRPKLYLSLPESNLKCFIIPRGESGIKYRKWMRQILKEWHYIPRQEVYGRRIYCLWYDDILEDLVAIVIFCNPQTVYLKDREAFIGWTDEQRKAKLNKNVCDEVRFLVLPHVRIKNLQSKILALSCKKVKAEWEARYGDKLVLITCFVDPKLYEGHSYLGAGFKQIGSTRDGKKIMAKPMENDWKEVLTR